MAKENDAHGEKVPDSAHSYVLRQLSVALCIPSLL